MSKNRSILPREPKVLLVITTRTRRQLILQLSLLVDQEFGGLSLPVAGFGDGLMEPTPEGPGENEVDAEGSMSKLGRCSDRHGESWDLVVVGSHGRIPSGEQVAQRAVESFGSGLQEPVGALLRPLHLFDHCICCFLAKRRLTTRLTVDSANAVEIRSPLNQRSL